MMAKKKKEITPRELTAAEETYRQNISKYRDQTSEAEQHSWNRRSLIIFTISSGGIYVVLEIIKFLKSLPNDQSIDYDRSLIVGTGVLFMVALVINLLDVLAHAMANRYLYKWADLELLDIQDGLSPEQKEELKKTLKIGNVFNSLASHIAWLDTSSMLAALICLGVFVNRYFI